MEHLGGAVHELPADTSEQSHEGGWVGLGSSYLLFRPVAEGDGLVVASEGGVKHLFEQCPLGAEEPVEGRKGDIGGVGNRLEGWWRDSRAR
jgi:hypothetical protein